MLGVGWSGQWPVGLARVLARLMAIGPASGRFSCSFVVWLLAVLVAACRGSSCIKFGAFRWGSGCIGLVISFTPPRCCYQLTNIRDQSWLTWTWSLGCFANPCAVVGG